MEDVNRWSQQCVDGTHFSSTKKAWGDKTSLLRWKSEDERVDRVDSHQVHMSDMAASQKGYPKQPLLVKGQISKNCGP